MLVTGNTTNVFVLFYINYKKNIVAAFRGMHVSPAKHTVAMREYHQESVTTGQTDGQTDRPRTEWSLCAAMLRRRHNDLNITWCPSCWYTCRYQQDEDQVIIILILISFSCYFHLIKDMCPKICGNHGNWVSFVILWNLKFRLPYWRDAWNQEFKCLHLYGTKKAKCRLVTTSVIFIFVHNLSVRYALLLLVGLCNIIGLPIYMYCNILVSNTYCNTFFRIAIYIVFNIPYFIWFGTCSSSIFFL